MCSARHVLQAQLRHHNHHLVIIIIIIIIITYLLWHCLVPAQQHFTNRKDWYNKKLSYPQRKWASNVAILYGADGISTWNCISMASRVWQTAYVGLVSGAICGINTKVTSSTRSRDSVAVDSLRPVFNTLVRGEPLNTGPRNLASRN